MKYLITEYPRFCPNCGQDNSGYSHEEINDFNSDNSFNCNRCSARFQRLTNDMQTKLKEELDVYWDTPC